MSKQSLKIISYGMVVFIAIVLFQNLFAQTDKNAVQQAVKEGAFLVDVRSPQEFAAGHVKGSINIPLSEVESRIQEFKNKKKIVVFCASGNRSGQAKNILERQGLKDVINGGAWRSVDKIVNP